MRKALILAASVPCEEGPMRLAALAGSGRRTRWPDGDPLIAPRCAWRLAGRKQSVGIALCPHGAARTGTCEKQSLPCPSFAGQAPTAGSLFVILPPARHVAGREHRVTQEQLAGKVERLRRELEVLYRSESGWDTATINRVTDDLAEAEFALAEAKSRHMAEVASHRRRLPRSQVASCSDGSREPDCGSDPSRRSPRSAQPGPAGPTGCALSSAGR